MAYCCGSAFSLEDIIFTFIFGLQPAIRAVFAHETEVPKDKRILFENVFHIKRKEGYVYHARFSELPVTREGLCADSHEKDDKDGALRMYGKKKAPRRRAHRKELCDPQRYPDLLMVTVKIFQVESINLSLT